MKSRPQYYDPNEQSSGNYTLYTHEPADGRQIFPIRDPQNRGFPYKAILFLTVLPISVYYLIPFICIGREQLLASIARRTAPVVNPSRVTRMSQDILLWFDAFNVAYQSISMRSDGGGAIGRFLSDYLTRRGSNFR